MAKKLKYGTLFPVADEEWCPAGVHRDRGPCTFNQPSVSMINKMAPN